MNETFFQSEISQIRNRGSAKEFLPHFIATFFIQLENIIFEYYRLQT